MKILGGKRLCLTSLSPDSVINDGEDRSSSSPTKAIPLATPDKRGMKAEQERGSLRGLVRIVKNSLGDKLQPPSKGFLSHQ